MLDTPFPGIRRLLAPNPSPMTGPGTNGYILGEGRVLVVDPGPDDERHLAAWRRALGDEEVAAILVTHAHADHSGLARRLADAVAAPVMGFGPAHAGRSPAMARLAEGGGLAGGEGVDTAFAPDTALSDGDRLREGGVEVEVLHVPGHFAGHLAFVIGDIALTGDHVLGWTSTLISPPDGDVRQFMASCARLASLEVRTFLPGHGDPVVEPRARLDWLVRHRRAREAEILARLAEGPATIPDLVGDIYTETPRALLPAASRSVLAHLVALVEDGRVEARPDVTPSAVYRLCDAGEQATGRPRGDLL